MKFGLTNVCSYDHAVKFSSEQANKAKAKKALQVRKDEAMRNREDTLRIKKRSEWMADCQAVFNRFIRLRDAKLPCICCERFGEGESWKTGGTFDAGHFLGVGAYPELRFVEENCHKQLKSCNAGSGKYSHKARTVSQKYRERLILKIGIDRVEWLEGPHEPKQYTIDELAAMKKHYAAKCLELKAGLDNAANSGAAGIR